MSLPGMFWVTPASEPGEAIKVHLFPGRRVSVAEC